MPTKKIVASSRNLKRFFSRTSLRSLFHTGHLTEQADRVMQWASYPPAMQAFSCFLLSAVNVGRRQPVLTAGT